MALFSLNNGRLHPAQSTLHDAPEVVDEALIAVRDQVTELLHQPFFPVAWLTEPGRPGHSERQTSLVALEPSGQTVTIDVVRRVDATSLMSALARAGRHNDMSRGKLAGLYPRGAAAFRRDWQDFLDSCPSLVEAGPRLIMLCLELDDEVRGALDSLLGTGVQLYRIMLHEADSGVLVSLDEIQPHEASFRTIAQAASRVEIESAPAGQTPEYVDDDMEGVYGEEDKKIADAPVVNDLASAFEPEPDQDTETETQSEPGITEPVEDLDEPDASQATHAGDETVVAHGDETVEPDVDEEAPHVEEQTGQTITVDPDMASLVEREGELDVTFVSRRRGVNASGRVTRDGFVMDGQVFPGPDEAASHAMGRDGDGWLVWKTPEGFSLRDLV